ncbi:hypothetical protein MSAN_00554600 [Mycena sanguinolenta]|uniref:Uncharacterized protein n=1 Tax=Mycena sanguinolenta TaxID=230812 RepID=A0A8H7DFE3_9AGAR|nr:hypothetical protein MSAN_00554600 [Mycena sanguinolenta]
MQEEPSSRFTWAVIQPSPVPTVEYAKSELLTAAAREIKCRQYLALVLEQPPNRFGRWSWIAFIVEPATLCPLPQTYLPIRPCTSQTRDSEPLDPGFEWPFAECVVNTSDVNPVTGIFVPDVIDTGKAPYVLSESEAVRFREVFMKDREEIDIIQEKERKMRIKEDRRAAGFSDRTDYWWTSTSPESTQIPRLPGELFPRLVLLSAKVHYDLSATDDFGTLNDWREERKTILRLLARFLNPSTERAIRWAHNIQVLDGYLVSPYRQENVPDLTCAPIVKLASLLDRPSSPVNQVEDASATQMTEEDDVAEDWSDSEGGC